MVSGLVEELRRKSARLGATIVYPEPQDARIPAAAALAAEESIARPLLVGRPGDLPAQPGAAVAVEAIEDSAEFDRLARAYALRRGVKANVARRLVRRPLIYGAMLVALGRADGLVAGICHSTVSVLQAAGLTIGYRKGVSRPSSCIIMLIPRLRGRRNVPLVFADCAVNVEPAAEDLARIALDAARTARHFLGVLPRVAMLSFSTCGSAAHDKVHLVRRAARLAAEKIQDGFVEGEYQLDAALIPEVAEKKVKEKSEVAGRANVLVFPDLNAGNIAYKAVQYLGGARAVGPMLLGFAKPVNDLSRGATVEDILAVTAVTVLQTQMR